MKRLALLIALIALTVGSVDAQFRIRKRPYVAPASAVTITVPTGNPTFVAASTPLTVEGTSSGAVTQVTWSNDRGGSGTATGVGAWTIAASAGSATVFQDTATCVTTTPITSMVPSIGTSWTEAVDSAGSSVVNCRTSGYYQPAATVYVGERLIVTATPNASSGTDYDVSVTVAGTGGSGSRWALIYAYTDANNYCGVSVANPNTTPDTVWFKYVAGAPTTLTPSFSMDASASDVVRLEVRDTVGTLYKNGVQVGTATDAVCNDTTKVGMGWGAVNGTGDVSASVRLDNFTVDDQAGSAGGIVLQTGTNVITVTGKDSGGSTVATDVLTVTYGASDTTPPGIVIDNPTVNTTYPTATAALTVSGTATDNVGDIAVTWACAACSGATSGSATGEVAGMNTPWTLSLTLTCSAAPGTENTIIVTATDTATNTGTDQLVATCVSADVTAPTVTIITNGGTDFATATSPVTLVGTASDTGSGLASVRCDCPTCTPTTIPADGLSNWSVSLTPANGANLVTCHALDNASPANDGTDTITVTYNQPLAIVTASPLPSVTEDVAMTTQTMTAVGGSGTYTWTNNGAGTTLNDGDAECAGMVLADVGNTAEITGTPTTVGTCSFVANANGTTKAFTIAVVAAGTDGNAYFDALIQRADWWKGLSYRPNGAKTCTSSEGAVSFASGVKSQGTCNPYFGTQLATTGADNYTGDVITAEGAAHAYDATVGGLKMTFPAYTSRITPAWTLTEGISDSATTLKTSIPSSLKGIFVNLRGIRIENEIVVCTNLLDFDPTKPGQSVCSRTAGTVVELNVTRGQYGTAAAMHSSGVVVASTASGLTTQQQIKFPLFTTDGHTYFFTHDVRFSEGWTGITGNPGMKTWQFKSGGEAIWWETKLAFNGGGSSGSSICTGWDGTPYAGTMVAGVSSRVYHPTFGSTLAWTDTDGNTAGDNVTDTDPLLPMAAPICIVPERWTRLYWFIDQRANDYDLISFWIGDEQQNPVKVIDALKISVRPTGSPADQIYNFVQEWNDDTRSPFLGTVDPFRVRYVWLRNFGVLRDPPGADYATPGSGLLIKPLPVQ